MKNWITRARSFLSEVIAETKKAKFPSRDELISTTVVVLVTSVIFAAYLYVADSGINWALITVLGR